MAKYEYYALRSNPETHRVELYNIFDNPIVNEATKALVESYVEREIKFPQFCLALDRVFEQQLWAQSQYEMMAGNLSSTNLAKWDCYAQAHANIRLIAHMIIEKTFEEMYEIKDWG